jgi:hypothetical protein
MAQAIQPSIRLTQQLVQIPRQLVKFGVARRLALARPASV